MSEPFFLCYNRAMKQEIPFLDISGKYGGNQYVFTHLLMKRGGCSTICACHASILLACQDPSRADLSPIRQLTMRQSEFDAFAADMFRFVYPGERGVPATDLFAQAYLAYAREKGVPVRIEQLQGSESYAAAEAFIRRMIDDGYTVQYLLLRHQSPSLQQIQWHWFTVTGYDDHDGQGFDILFSTFGQRQVASLSLLWDTGMEEKGGLLAIL